MSSYHEEGLKYECDFEVFEGVKVESEDIGDEEDEADVDGESSD